MLTLSTLQQQYNLYESRSTRSTITVYSTVHITQQVCSGAGHGDSVTYFSRKGINYSLVFWFSSTAKHPATSVRRQTLGLHPWTTTFRKHLGTRDYNLDIHSYDITASQSTSHHCGSDSRYVNGSRRNYCMMTICTLERLHGKKSVHKSTISAYNVHTHYTVHRAGTDMRHASPSITHMTSDRSLLPTYSVAGSCKA